MKHFLTITLAHESADRFKTKLSGDFVDINKALILLTQYNYHYPELIFGRMEESPRGYKVPQILFSAIDLDIGANDRYSLKINQHNALKNLKKITWDDAHKDLPDEKEP